MRTRLGHHDPRRLRPDRDHRAGRQLARASRSSPARWAGRCPATRSCCSTRRPASRPTRARSASTSSPRPLGLMAGYHDDAERDRRGDARRLLPHRRRRARRDADGYITYVGRADDVFKASDYRISPVRAGERADRARGGRRGGGGARRPDPVRLAVPKAYVVLAAGLRADRGDRAGDLRATAASAWRRTSGSAGSSSPSCPRRSPARSAGSSCATPEEQRGPHRRARDGEFREEDFPELKR